jgi:hypothetical protein
MGDLEHVAPIIARIMHAATNQSDPISEWVSPPREMEWPAELRIRLLRILQAAQRHDYDEIIATTIELEHEAGLIERRYEHVAMRRSGA